MVSIGTSGGESATSTQGGNSGSESGGGMYAREAENHNNMANSGGSSAQEGNSSKSDDEKRPPFSMHGVLHFLEHEWSRYEKERTQWEMERAELRARISFLLGERKGQENLKRDLVRRVKMLEYALKQERAKVYRLTHNGEDPEPDELDEQLRQELESMVPLDVDAVQQESGNPPAWKQARQMLTQYLQEIGYSEKILDVRSFRVKDLPNRLNNVANEKALLESERAILETAEQLRGGNLSFKGSGRHVVNYDSGSDNDEKNLDKDTAEALDEFAFLTDDNSAREERKAPAARMTQALDRAAANLVGQAGEKGDDRRMQDYKERKEKMREERKRGSSSDTADAGMIGPGKKSAGPDALMDINAALGLAPDEGAVDINDDFAMNDDETMSVRWGMRYSLRSHYDSVRAMQFHPVEPLLLTASEDGTAKLWNLNAKATGENVKSPQAPRPTTGVVDIEPTYTFRGHKGAIVSMDMNPTGDFLYTGGQDGTICCWRMPPRDVSIEDPYDSSILAERLTGHTDIVWAVAFHSSTNRIISASADGTVRLWETGDSAAGQSLLRTFTPPTLESRPRSIDVVSTEPQQLLTAYSKGLASILDLETGKTVLSFDLVEEGENVGEINKIISHPTLPVTILAGEDRRIRYLDNNTGKLIHGTVAHVEGVSTLAADTNGLYLLSGSHDGSLRLWNMETKICLQEIAAHHKKHDASVLSVAFHPSRPLIGSAGADGLAKVYTSERSQYAGGSHFAE